MISNFLCGFLSLAIHTVEPVIYAKKTKLTSLHKKKKTNCQGSNAWLYSTKTWPKGKEATAFQKLEPTYLTTPWNSTNFRIHLSMGSNDIIVFIEGAQKTYFCRQKIEYF